MPKIPIYDAPNVTLHPDQEGSAALARAGAIAQHYGTQTRAILDREGEQLQSGIDSFKPVFEKAQEHTDMMAEAGYIKADTENQVMFADALERGGAPIKNTDGSVAAVPSSGQYATAASDVLEQHAQFQQNAIEQARANGASQKMIDRLTVRAAQRNEQLTLKAHAVDHARQVAEVTDNYNKSMNATTYGVYNGTLSVDDAFKNIDQMNETLGRSSQELKLELGPRAIAAKGNVIMTRAAGLIDAGHDDEAKALVNDPKYKDIVGGKLVEANEKVNSLIRSRDYSQARADQAKEDEIGFKQDQLTDQIIRNSKLPPEQQDKNLTYARLERDELFKDRPQDLDKAQKAVEESAKRTVDPFKSQQRLAEGSHQIGDTLTTRAQVDQFYNSHKDEMTWQDRGRLMSELNDFNNDPGSHAIAAERKDFFTKYAATIDPSKAQNFGQPSALGQQNQFKAEQAAKRLENIIKTQGLNGTHDPHSLYDPESANYFAKQIPKYYTSLKDAQDYEKQLMKGLPPEQGGTPAGGPGAAPVQGGAKQVPEWKPGDNPVAVPKGTAIDDIKKWKPGTRFIIPDGSGDIGTVPQKMNFAPESQGKTPAVGAINAALSAGVDAHADKNLFSSGRAARMGLAGGVGENLTTIVAQGHPVRVNSQAAPHFQGFLNELEQRGYKITDIGGYSDRMKRGGFGAGYSEHAYGNAIDINPNANQQSSRKTDLPSDIAAIAAKYGLIWGGNWSGRSRDPMHFEWSGKGGVAVAER